MTVKNDDVCPPLPSQCRGSLTQMKLWHCRRPQNSIIFKRRKHQRNYVMEISIYYCPLCMKTIADWQWMWSDNVHILYLFIRLSSLRDVMMLHRVYFSKLKRKVRRWKSSIFISQPLPPSSPLWAVLVLSLLLHVAVVIVHQLNESQNCWHWHQYQSQSWIQLQVKLSSQRHTLLIYSWTEANNVYRAVCLRIRRR